MNTSAAPPPGFEALPGRYEHSFVSHIGPFMARREADGALTVGVRLEPRHCNPFGEMHGGFLAGLADFACAYAMLNADNPTPSVVTVQLSIQMMASARLGDWLEARTSIRRRGRTIAHAGCDFMVGDAAVAHAEAVFRVLSDAGTETRRRRAHPPS